MKRWCTAPLFRKHTGYNLLRENLWLTEKMARQRENSRKSAPHFVPSVSVVPVRQDEPCKKCTMPAKHGALYPWVVDLPYRVFLTNLRVGWGRSISFWPFVPLRMYEQELSCSFLLCRSCVRNIFHGNALASFFSVAAPAPKARQFQIPYKLIVYLQASVSVSKFSKYRTSCVCSSRERARVSRRLSFG